MFDKEIAQLLKGEGDLVQKLQPIIQVADNLNKNGLQMTIGGIPIVIAPLNNPPNVIPKT